MLEEWRAQRNKHTSCCHNKEEDYQLLKISVYEHRDTKRLYTTEQIDKRERKNGMYYKIDLKNAFLKGFLQQIQGIFIVSVAVNGNHCANHYIVFDTGRGLIIDPNFERPILFQWAYTNGKLDEKKWKEMLRILQYSSFAGMYKVYSKNSRFSDPGLETTNRDSRQQTESTPEAKRTKACIFFKKGKCKNGDICKFVHSTIEAVLDATAVKKKFFCNGLTCDIVERIIGVQIR